MKKKKPKKTIAKQKGLDTNRDSFKLVLECRFSLISL